MITNFNFSQLTPFFESAARSTGLSVLKRKEDTLRQGYSYLLTSVCQLGQIYFASKQFDVLLKARNCSSSSSFYQTTIFCAVPAIIINWAAKKDIKNPLLNRTLYFLHDNIGTLCQIVSVVTAVALLQLGSTVFASTSLLFLTLGYIERSRILPLYCRAIIHQIGFITGTLSLLIVGDPLDKCISAINLIGEIANYCLVSKKSAMSIQKQLINSEEEISYLSILDMDNILNSPVNHLTNNTIDIKYNLADLIRVLKEREKIEINHQHLLIDPLPPTVNEDITNLNAYFENIDWNKELPVLRKKLASDERWIKRYAPEGWNQQYGLDKNNSLKDNQTVNLFSSDKAPEIQYLRKQLHILVDSIKEKKILHGEPHSYENLHNYLKMITHLIEEQPIIERVGIFMKLGIEGGEYCGSGLYRSIEEIYSGLLAQTDRFKNVFSFKQRLLISLQQQRFKIFQNFYLHTIKIWNSIPIIGRFIDPTDIHFFNLLANFYALDFGLPDQGSQKDEIAAMNFSDILIAHYICHSGQKILWTDNPNIHGYTTNNIVSYLSEEAIGTNSLPYGEVTQWALSWIEKKRILLAEQDQTTKAVQKAIKILDDFEEGLSENGKYGQAEWIEKQGKRTLQIRYSTPLINAMLVDMGIFKLKK